VMFSVPTLNNDFWCIINFCIAYLLSVLTRVAYDFLLFLQPAIKKRKQAVPSTTFKLTMFDNDDAQFIPVVINFQQQAKVVVPFSDDPSPLDFVKMYFTEHVIDLLVVETNRYAEQYTANNVIPLLSPINCWHATDRDEMYAFLGITILMGLYTSSDCPCTGRRTNSMKRAFSARAWPVIVICLCCVFCILQITI